MEKWWLVTYDTDEYRYLYAKVYAGDRTDVERIMSHSPFASQIVIRDIQPMEDYYKEECK